METSKEQMSKYLERMQYLQRLCLGYSVYIESRSIEGVGVSLDFCVLWKYGTDTKCKCFYVCDWYDKERNDAHMKKCVDFLSNVRKWI